MTLAWEWDGQCICYVCPLLVLREQTVHRSEGFHAKAAENPALTSQCGGTSGQGLSTQATHETHLGDLVIGQPYF